MGRWSVAVGFGIMLAPLAGCDQPQEQPAAPLLGSLPADLCVKVKASVARLVKTAVMESDGAGSATIEETAWLSLGKSGQDRLVQALAFEAVCNARAAPATQEVTVRNEGGRILVNRIVEIAPDQGAIFEDE
ncbi:hypothetical protein [Sphingosinicella sp. BN140058]|uniref:hypothetical protein n=1 Tax=Sphingosinicella sp. BN140058 TaxID=1892855 RepID=UPI001011E7E5|nr:hypothetical protein [Sphingosinicella sp. BN140058]QAY77058.1 hypothetical protein ETR14_11535 [Sphingosinicella sp. BN140058]